MLGGTVAPLRRSSSNRSNRRERGAAPPSMVIVSGVLVGLVAGVGLERLGAVDPLEEPTPAVVRIDRVSAFDCPDGIPVASLARGDEVVVVARSEDGDWLEIRSPVREDQRAWVAIGVVGGEAGAAASALPVRGCGDFATTTTTSTTSTTSTTTTSTTSTTTTSTTTTTTPTTTTRPDAPTDIGILAVTGQVGGLAPPASTTSTSTPSTSTASTSTTSTVPGTSTTLPPGAFHYVHAVPAQGGAACPSIATLRLTVDDGDGVARVRIVWSTGSGGATAIVQLQRGSGSEWATSMQFPAVAVPEGSEQRSPSFEVEVTDGNGVVSRAAATLAHPFRVYGATALPCER